MAVDYNNGFVTIGPDDWDKTQGRMIGDYMQIHPDSRIEAGFNQGINSKPAPGHTVWETGLRDLAGALNRASNFEHGITEADLTMGTPTDFYAGNTDWNNIFRTTSPNNAHGVQRNSTESTAAALGLSNEGKLQQQNMGDVVPHEVSHLWDTVFGTPYNHGSTRPEDNWAAMIPILDKLGVTRDMIGTPEMDAVLAKLSQAEVDALDIEFEDALKGFYAGQDEWHDRDRAYGKALTDTEKWMIDADRYNAEQNQTLTGYADRDDININNPRLSTNPNTASGEWGYQPTEFEQMQQSWARSGGRIIQDPVTGEYKRDDGMYDAMVKRFMDNPNNDKLGLSKTPLAEAVATSLTDIGYDTNMYRNAGFDSTYEKDWKGNRKWIWSGDGPVYDKMTYLNKPEERWARYISSIVSPKSNEYDLFQKLADKYTNRDYISMTGPSYSQDAMNRGDDTLSAISRVLAENRRMGW